MSSFRPFKVSLIAVAVSHSLFVNTANATTINVDEVCSLRDAIVAANTDTTSNGCPAGGVGADTIVLAAASTITLTDVDVDGGGYAGLPVITSNITIQGNGSTITRDATAPNFRLITMGTGSSLYLDSVSLTNGMENASAIFAENANTLVLTNSQVSNNSSPVGNAGILTRDTDVFIDQSLITNNSTATGRVRQDRAGITVENGNLVIHDSVITGNITGSSGNRAGIYVTYGDFELINSTVSQNVSNLGSGISIYGANSINIQNSDINDNSGPDAGLQIYSYERTANIQISDTNINNNDGSFSGLYIGGYSYNNNTMLVNISNCEVKGNQSNSPVGLRTRGSSVQATIDTCDISENVGSTSFGSDNPAGLEVSGGATVFITNSQISQNVIEGIAGVKVEGSSLIIENSTISMNSITGVGSASGISASNSTLSINQSVVSNNDSSYATGSPSAVKIIDTIATIDETSIESNTSNGPGGGIRLTGTSSELTLLNSTIANNVALNSNMGGGLYLNGGDNVVIANTTISGNQSDTAAGIYSTGFNSVELTNVTIANNVASNTAGGISFSVEPTTLSINNTLVSNNTGGDCGLSLANNLGTNNWFQDDSCNGVAQGDPLILPLDSNGGLTSTHALDQNSPAINQGNNTLCTASPVSALDQRGETRDSQCDIGAYELQEESESVFVIPAANGKVIIFSL